MNYCEIIERFSRTPITFEYRVPTSIEVNEIKEKAQIVTLKDNSRLILDQTYFRVGLSGAAPETYTRRAVADRIQGMLPVLGDSFGFIVYDAYRSIQTQRSLFHAMENQIKIAHPSWTREEVFSEACKFVVNPDLRSSLLIPPHNSGGAIDLALHADGKVLDFGTEFDSPEPASATAFFESEYNTDFGYSVERWNLIRANRRILFHAMSGHGFTNYPEEWWHYDLGNCMWSQALGLPWVYGSMEEAFTCNSPCHSS